MITRALSLAMVLSLLASAAAAQTPCATADSGGTARYVRSGATGANNGLNWTDAFTTIPATMTRGFTYCIADGTGTYTVPTFDDAASGTTTITIAKATVADHGTNTGWVDTFGDGQATMSAAFFGTSYWVVNGQTRNESDWSVGTAYGFRFTGRLESNAANNGGICADNITVSYVDVGAADVGNVQTGSEISAGFYTLMGEGAGGNTCNTWTMQRNRIHNTVIPLHMNGNDGGTIEYNWIGHSFGKEALRGQNRFKNFIIRYNRFKDSCQTGADLNICTGEIALWDGATAGDFDGNEIYGNVIYKTTAEPNSGGAIIVGGDGVSWVGVSASNVLVYNNTIAGITGGTQGGILINGGSGNFCRNTLWYDVTGTPTCGGAGVTASDNGEQGTDPFVNYAAENFHLSAAIAGFSLGSPYNTDLDSVTRGGDSTFDRGAYEFAGAAAAKTRLRLR